MSGTLLVTLAVVLAGKFERAASESLEICDAEDYTISCRAEEVIVMNAAEFGRKEVGRCITETDDFMGCTNDVLPLLDRWCSGRRECELEVPNQELKNANENCLAILIKYLSVEYTCVSVMSRCSPSTPNHISQRHGLISSHVARAKGCGSTRSPWVISANTGQTVNMSLIDFSVDRETQGLVTCRHVYGYILERALGINHTICGGKHREGELYSSKTNKVEIYINTGPSLGQFLVLFEVKGCSDLARPPDAWYKREGSEAVIGCETNDQQWRLTCTGNTWQGSVGNCSTSPVSAQNPDLKADEEEEAFDINSVSVVMLTAIVGGALVLAVIAVVAGVVYIKKYRMKEETRQMQKTYATVDRNTLAYYRPVNVDPATNQQAPPSWDAPLTDKEAGTLTSYPGQCSCATLHSRDSRNISIGGSMGKQHVYNSIGGE